MHILLWLVNSREHGDAKVIKNIISVEILEKEREPELDKVVSQFMVHGPCGNRVTHAPCMSEDI